jgi:23S rRNA (adenine2503-C2)-methyltransferase
MRRYIRDIKELTLKELEEYLAKNNWPKFHARQVFSWVYKKNVAVFQEMSDLPGPLQKQLKDNFSLLSLKLAAKQKSRDGTQKLLLELNDKNLIEAVIIPTQNRVTGCISTQAGCKFACKFCASGMGGFKRNLTYAEMCDEILHLKNNAQDNLITHLVFMGIGEPLDNYDNLLKAVRIINAAWGFNIGARRITVSTCGISPGIEKLADEGLQIELSVSLHAADDKTRSRIMPVNKIYSLKNLIGACQRYVKKTNRQITFEYALIKGINSDLQNALNLSTILKAIKLAKVNLIPANFIQEYGVEPPKKLEILLFRDYLLKQGVNVTLRKLRGADIEAACGQLRLKNQISNIKNQNDNAKIKD